MVLIYTIVVSVVQAMPSYPSPWCAGRFVDEWMNGCDQLFWLYFVITVKNQQHCIPSHFFHVFTLQPYIHTTIHTYIHRRSLCQNAHIHIMTAQVCLALYSLLYCIYPAEAAKIRALMRQPPSDEETEKTPLLDDKKEWSYSMLIVSCNNKCQILVSRALLIVN